MLGFFDPSRASPTALAWRKRLAANDKDDDDDPPDMVHENIEKALKRHKVFNREHSKVVKGREMRKGISVDDHGADPCDSSRQRPGSIQQSLKPGRVSAAQSNYLANKLEQKFGICKTKVLDSTCESSSTAHGSTFRGGALASLSPYSSTTFRNKTGRTDFGGASSSELLGVVLPPPTSPGNAEFPARLSLSSSQTNFHQLHADSSGVFSPGTSQTDFQKRSMASAVLGGSSSEGSLRPNSKGFNVSFDPSIGNRREIRTGGFNRLGPLGDGFPKNGGFDRLGSLCDGSPKKANPVEREKLRREQFAAERAQRRKAYYSSLQQSSAPTAATDIEFINSEANIAPRIGLGDVALTSRHAWYSRFRHVH